MQRLAETCEAIAATTRKLRKTAIVADYLKSRTTGEAAISAVFLSGRAFPAWEETTLQVGGALLSRVVADLSGKDEAALTAAYRKHGDLGAVARDVLARATPLEAKYIVKIMTGDLRIGLKESLVEDAIAQAYGDTQPGSLKQVQRTNMLLGDIGETLRLAVEGKLAEAKMRLFHPIGFMLASPIESPEEGLSYFSDAAVEDKYDGIRAQAHVSEGEVKFFSRTRDEITESFPELPDALAGLHQDAVLDGEILAWGQPGRARPFSVLQQRLGRKKVSDRMLREIPVAYLCFYVFDAGGKLLIDLPLRERALILDELLQKENLNQTGRREAQRRIGAQGKLTF